MSHWLAQTNFFVKYYGYFPVIRLVNFGKVVRKLLFYSSPAVTDFAYIFD